MKAYGGQMIIKSKLKSSGWWALWVFRLTLWPWRGDCDNATDTVDTCPHPLLPVHSNQIASYCKHQWVCVYGLSLAAGLCMDKFGFAKEIIPGQRNGNIRMYYVMLETPSAELCSLRGPRSHPLCKTWNELVRRPLDYWEFEWWPRICDRRCSYGIGLPSVNGDNRILE